MTQSSRQFIEMLLERSPSLVAVYRENVEYWMPEEPPVTVLFGEFGSKIVEDFAQIGIEAKQGIFSLIDDAVTDDGELGTAVATGMIEAMVNEAEVRNLWQPISESFGKHSRDYIDAWFAQQARIAADLAS